MNEAQRSILVRTLLLVAVACTTWVTFEFLSTAFVSVKSAHPYGCNKKYPPKQVQCPYPPYWARGFDHATGNFSHLLLIAGASTVAGLYLRAGGKKEGSE